jgi:hypothetical protein
VQLKLVAQKRVLNSVRDAVGDGSDEEGDWCGLDVCIEESARRCEERALRVDSLCTNNPIIFNGMILPSA